MASPLDDESPERPRRQVAPGCNSLFFAVFLLLLAIVAFIAWQRSPPDAPTPAATAQPVVVGQAG